MIERDRAADDILSTSEVILPKTIAQDSHTGAAATVIVGHDKTAGGRANTESIEVTTAGKNPVRVADFAALSKIKLRGTPGKNTGKNILMISELFPERISER